MIFLDFCIPFGFLRGKHVLALHVIGHSFTAFHKMVGN